MIRGLVSVTRSASREGLACSARAGSGPVGDRGGIRGPSRVEGQDDEPGPDRRAHEEMQGAQAGRQEVKDHRRRHGDLHQRRAQNHRGPEAELPGPRPGIPSQSQRPARRAAPGTRTRGRGASNAVRRAAPSGGSALPLQRGKPRQRSPASKLATWAPNRITTKPSSRRGQHQAVRPVPLSLGERQAGRRGGAQRDHEERREQQHRVGEVGDDDRRGEDQLDRHGAEEDLDHQDHGRQQRRIAELGLASVPSQGHHGDREDEHAHRRGGPPVADLDQGGEVERREPLPVTSGPVIAAAHSGPGDPDDPAENDEAEGKAAAGPGQTPEQSGPVQISRCIQWNAVPADSGGKERCAAGPCQGYI